MNFESTNSDNQMNGLRELVQPTGLELLAQDVRDVCDWLATDERKSQRKSDSQSARKDRARIRAVLTQYRQTITYLKQQIRERDALLLTLKAETDAMAAVIKDIKKSYGIRVVA
ncbi:hypothetical protein LEP1GSC163_0203 [Leptospira santarosai str. CBC379]|uniref:hypothetical protein n=1 Tax=Leptospira santarosai TaxID=28183 RepID=UPI0002981996|nr:hypothetical protein [Leptospira santarosai]EKR89706.1 hypothetical protein LEP1GSC163_0203 [Leptospira santarosai str. CBC379]